jgi:hypothetical protein
MSIHDSESTNSIIVFGGKQFDIRMHNLESERSRKAMDNGLKTAKEVQALLYASVGQEAVLDLPEGTVEIVVQKCDLNECPVDNGIPMVVLPLKELRSRKKETKYIAMGFDPRMPHIGALQLSGNAYRFSSPLDGDY